MEKPNCQINKCKEKALFLFSGLYVCGNCFSKYYFENEKRKKEEMNRIINGGKNE